MRANILRQTLLIFTSLLIFTACNNEEENSEEEVRTRLVPVETLTMVPDSFEDYIRITGTIEAVEDAVVSAETQGRILEIVDRGTFLNQGDIVARLDDRLIQAQYNAAKTAYELALDNFERLEPLHADSIISTQVFNSARAQKDQAKAQLDQSEKQLQDSHVEAPFSGRVESRMAEKGELISPGMPVVRLVNTSTLKIIAGIPERYSGQIKEGTPVRFSIPSASLEMIQSEIAYAGNVIDPDTRTYTAEVEVANTNELLKPDMVVNLRVQRQTLNDAMIIPRNAVLRNEEGTSVFKVLEHEGNKIARLVTVETGQASGALIEIISGIKPGDEIVFSGMSNLNDGDRLNILNTESSMERAEQLARAEKPFVSY